MFPWKQVLLTPPKGVLDYFKVRFVKNYVLQVTIHLEPLYTNPKDLLSGLLMFCTSRSRTTFLSLLLSFFSVLVGYRTWQ